MATETYDTHDNGGRPFRVRITGDTVSVHTLLPWNGVENTYAEQPSMTVKGKVFVGKSPLIKMTRSSGGSGPEFDGNTIVVQTGNLEYIYIGEKVFKFKTLAPLTKYESPVGNNDVPYPYGVDSEGRVYLMLEGGILINPADETLEDVYNEYWNRQRSGNGIDKMTIVSTISQRDSKQFNL